MALGASRPSARSQSVRDHAGTPGQPLRSTTERCLWRPSANRNASAPLACVSRGRVIRVARPYTRAPGPWFAHAASIASAGRPDERLCSAWNSRAADDTAPARPPPDAAIRMGRVLARIGLAASTGAPAPDRRRRCYRRLEGVTVATSGPRPTASRCRRASAMLPRTAA